MGVSFNSRLGNAEDEVTHAITAAFGGLLICEGNDLWSLIKIWR